MGVSRAGGWASRLSEPWPSLVPTTETETNSDKPVVADYGEHQISPESDTTSIPDHLQYAIGRRLKLLSRKLKRCKSTAQRYRSHEAAPVFREPVRTTSVDDPMYNSINDSPGTLDFEELSIVVDKMHIATMARPALREQNLDQPNLQPSPQASATADDDYEASSVYDSNYDSDKNSVFESDDDSITKQTSMLPTPGGIEALVPEADMPTDNKLSDEARAYLDTGSLSDSDDSDATYHRLLPLATPQSTTPAQDPASSRLSRLPIAENQRNVLMDALDAKTREVNKYLFEKATVENEHKRVLALSKKEAADYKAIVASYQATIASQQTRIASDQATITSQQTTIASHQAMVTSLQDPEDPRHLKYKNIRLEKENAELPKLRSRVEQADKERTELLALRPKEAEFNEKIQYTDTLTRKLYVEGEVVKSLKQENIELKKNTTQAEVSRQKKKLHSANVKIEEFIQTNRAAETSQSKATNSEPAAASPSDEKNDDDSDSDNEQEAKHLNIARFQFSPGSMSPSYVQESVRLLRYMRNLHAEVNERATKINETRGGQGWSASQQLETLMMFCRKETCRATKMVLGLDRTVKMGSEGFSKLPKWKKRQKGYRGGRQSSTWRRFHSTRPAELRSTSSLWSSGHGASSESILFSSIHRQLTSSASEFLFS